MNLNKAFVLGNVTRDPEVRALPSGQQVTSFGIATNRFYTDASGQKKQEAEFHNIVCFGKLADISSKYLNKGSLVLIEGRIKTRNWQDTSGIKHYKTEIIAESLQLGPKNLGGSGGQYNKNESSFAKSSDDNKDIPIIEENQLDSSNNTDEINIKDIPF